MPSLEEVAMEQKPVWFEGREIQMHNNDLKDKKTSK